MADFQKKVALIEVDIDQAAAKKSVEQLTDSIINQKNAIKDNTDEIKLLSKGTEEEQKQAKELEKANFKLRDELKDLNSERRESLKATKLQSNSLDALRKKVGNQKRELNGLNTETALGSKRFKELTEKIKANNDQIVELDQSAGDFKTTVGRYKEELDGVGGSIGGVIQGFKGMTAAALKFIATPIGLVLGVIAGAVALVQNALNRSEESTNKLRRAFAPLEGIINLLLGALEPLGEFLIDGIVKGFELASEAASFFSDAIADGLDFLGFDDAAEGVREFKNEIKEAGEAAVKLADDEARLSSELRKQGRIQLEFQEIAEKIRQLRDDESRDIKQRIKDNEELGQVLIKQSAKELSIANLQLSVINQRMKMEGETTELLDERAEALEKIAEINERITSQESEQLSNLNGLRREYNDSIKAEEELRLEQLVSLNERKNAIIAEDQAVELANLEEHKMNLETIEVESFKKKVGLLQQFQNNSEAVTKAGQNAVSDIFEYSNNRIDNFYNSRIANVQTQLQKGQINEEEAARKIENLERNKAITQWKADRVRFRIQKATDIAGIAIDTARAITKSVAATPLTGGLPFSGIAAGIGAAQLATVISRKAPPAPTFAEGGMVVNGKSHSQGGEDVHVGGRLVGNMQGGEGLFVTKQEATANALSFMNEQAGGRSFFGSSSRYLQEGGSVDTTAPSGISRDEIIGIMANLPPLEVQAGSVMAGIKAEQKANNLGVV